MGIKSLSVPLVCMVLIAMIPAAMAVHTIEGGTGSISTATGAAVTGEVYSNTMPVVALEPEISAYELGIQAIIDQTGIGTSSVQWQTGKVVTKTQTLTTDAAVDTPKFTGVFSLGSSSVSADIKKTNALGSAHAEARIHTAGQVAGASDDDGILSGMAEITSNVAYSDLGAGTGNASANGNASYSIKEGTRMDPADPTVFIYGEIPLQVWGAVKGTATSSVSSAEGGSTFAESVIRSGSYATSLPVSALTGVRDGISAAGQTDSDIIVETADGLADVTIDQVFQNEIFSTTSVVRNYDGSGKASGFATSAKAESGAWDASVNEANPRTKGATESVYSKVEGTTIARSITNLGGDQAFNTGGIRSQVFHDSLNTASPGTSPLYTSSNPGDINDPDSNAFSTFSVSQRVTPGVDANKVTSEAFVANGNLTVKARDELPTTTVARLLQMNAQGAQLGSGAHLVNQATGFLTSQGLAGFGASFIVGDAGATPVTRDILETTHDFGIIVAGPTATGNILDDAGSYVQWGTEAGSTASTQFMSRPTVVDVTTAPGTPIWLNAYAAMTTSIAGENAVGWLSGDDTRFHMEAQGSLDPVVSNPTYTLVPTNDMIFSDKSTEPETVQIVLPTSRSDSLTRDNAGAEFQPANVIV